jgi:hypothetical protein
LICACDEYPIWEQKDKHKLAYAVLTGEGVPDKTKRTLERMESVLGKKATVPSTGCVSCHGIDAPKTQRDKDFEPDKEGVSCVVCHGPVADWVEKHQASTNRDAWHTKSRADKETLGLIDLWNPVKRTQKCASCHIGDIKENRFVTHEMYAAGHPPLPSFEAATFSEEMPHHWKYVSEKLADPTKYIRPERVEPFELTKLVAVGSVASLRHAMDVLAGQALKPNAGVLDFANFDCYACHHELKLPSWRQERGYTGAPGRPGMRPWPVALARIAIRHAATTSEEKEQLVHQFQDKLQAVHKAFSARPFGTPADIAKSAEALAQFAGKMCAKLDAKQFTQQEAMQILRELCSEKDLPDYDTARQIAWAFEIIYCELDQKPANSAQIREVLKKLKTELKLDLPSGPKKSIVEALPEALTTLNDYEPERQNPAGFKQRMQQLADLLPRS